MRAEKKFGLLRCADATDQTLTSFTAGYERRDSKNKVVQPGDHGAAK